MVWTCSSSKLAASHIKVHICSILGLRLKNTVEHRHHRNTWSPILKSETDFFHHIYIEVRAVFSTISHTLSDPLLLSCSGSETSISLVWLKISNRSNDRYSWACFNKQQLLNNPQLRVLILLVYNFVNHAPFQLHWTNSSSILIKCQIIGNYLLSNHYFRMFM